MEDPEKRFEETSKALLGALIYLEEVLAALPLPIKIVQVQNEDWTTDQAVQGLERARLELIPDQPIPGEAKLLLQGMVLDWLNASVLASITETAGFVPSILDGIDRLLNLIKAAGQAASKQIGTPPLT